MKIKIAHEEYIATAAQIDDNGNSIQSADLLIRYDVKFVVLAED